MERVFDTFMASVVTHATCKTSCKYVYARQSRYGMLIKETARISLTPSILNKETPVIDRLTAKRDSISLRQRSV